MNAGKVNEKTRCYLEGFGEGFPDALIGDLYFTWSCFLEGKEQTAYRICVTENPLSDCAGEVLWDTGWVISSKSSSILYEGKNLKVTKIIMLLYLLRIIPIIRFKVSPFLL